MSTDRDERRMTPSVRLSVRQHELVKIAEGFASRFAREGESSSAWAAIKAPTGDADSDLRSLVEAALRLYRARADHERQTAESSIAYTDETLRDLRMEPDD